MSFKAARPVEPAANALRWQNRPIFLDYQRARRSLFVQAIDTGRMVESRDRAVDAWRRVRVARAFAQHELSSDRDPVYGESIGAVRIRHVPDDSACLDDLLGDVPDTGWGKRYRKEQTERVNRDGAWGAVAEVWNGEKWIETDSIWGFIGDDFKGSGYDVDLMRSALDRRLELLQERARARVAKLAPKVARRLLEVGEAAPGGAERLALSYAERSCRAFERAALDLRVLLAREAY